MEYETTPQLSRLGVPLQHLKDEGGTPALLEAVTGDIRIRCDHAEAFKCWSLDSVGKGRAEVQLQRQGDALQLRLSHEQPAVYYELSAE